MQNGRIKAKEIKKCFLCDSVGENLHLKMRDHFHKVKGNWTILHCPNCKLAWLNPRPLPQEIKKLYSAYYTHTKKNDKYKWDSFRKKIKFSILSQAFGYKSIMTEKKFRIAGKILSVFPYIKKNLRRSIRELYAHPNGKLLDIGCGNGQFLGMMQELGWEVKGIEPDPKASKLAQNNFSVDIIGNTLEEANVSDNTFDAITMSHVLEHIIDPIKLLKKCRRVLKPTGKLIVITPNIESLGYKIFKESWLHLDPPRHLFLFSTRSIKSCLSNAGFMVESLSTSTRSSDWMWIASRIIQKNKIYSREKITRRLKIEAKFFRIAAEFAHILQSYSGEELVLIANKTEVKN